MRILLGCAIVLGLALVTPATAQKKGDKGKAAAIDGDLLVGKWESPPLKGIKAPKGPVIEFTKDGKCTMGSPGTYKLDGDKLTVTITGGSLGPDEVHKYTIKKLTKTEMIWYEGKMMTSLRRTK
ncbi:MAG TPA: lipocalin family protein [Gemmataceae bacterium]|nr:lipocalin family protein [Gemmataceae bacterium]